MKFRKRNVDSAQTIMDFEKLYNPNNDYIPLREGNSNPMSHGKAQNIWFTFDEKLQRGQILDDGIGIKDRDCLVVNVGTPRTEDPTAFDMQDKGIQAFLKITSELYYHTKNSFDEFKQLLQFPITVKEYGAEEDVNGYEWEDKPQLKTFTILRWKNTKKKWTYNEVIQYMRKTFEHAIRLKKVVFHIRNCFTGKYNLLEAWDYGSTDKFKIKKMVKINLSGKNWVLVGNAYQREINPDSHTKSGEYWISTKGILPNILCPTFNPSRMDIIVSANCDELRDALTETLGKETYSRGHAIYERILDELSRFVSDNFKKPKTQMREIEEKRQNDLNTALREAWKDRFGKEKENKNKDSKQNKINCKQCGKKIWRYPCKYCECDPNIKHVYHLKCNECNFEWDSPKKKDICPMCNSNNIKLIRQTKYNIGIPKIVFDEILDIINIRLGNPSLEIVIGKNNNYYKTLINRPQGVFNTAYSQGFLYDAMNVCEKWSYYMTPNGQQDLATKIAVWNDKAIKGLKMLNIILY